MVAGKEFRDVEILTSDAILVWLQLAEALLLYLSFKN